MNPSDWRQCTLGDLLEIKHGYAFSGDFFGSSGTHVVLTPGNFFERGGFKHKGDGEKWYSGPVPAEYVLRKGDVIVAMTEQAEGLLGSSAIVPEGDLYLHNQRLGLICLRSVEAADLRFIYYLFNLQDIRNQIRASASGVKIRHTSPSRISEVRVTVPPIDDQRQIGRILAAYDALLENNMRRIRVLEDMARALYREWFVSLNAPGLVHSVDSQELPHQWNRTPLRECVHVTPKVGVPREGSKPFLSMGALSNDSMLISNVEHRTGNSGSKFQNGDTLFARITPCLENGKTGFVQFLPDASAVAFGSTEFIVLRSKTLTPEFVYLLSRTDEFRGTAIKSMSGASGRQRVQERCFDSVSVVQPPTEILARFTEIVRPMFRLVHQLHLQNLNVRATRDLLLSRLLSGQLSLAKSEGDPARFGQTSAALV